MNTGLPLVLVVDDTPGNLQVVAEVLEQNGFEAALAADGALALEFAARERPDLILLDVLMPGLDGLEVCRRLKASEKTRSIPVIFLTALAECEQVVQGFDAGGVDYVSKPFHAAELLARVRTHVELARARAEIRTLRKILPICSYCRKVRTPSGEWVTFECYIEEHTGTMASHGLCRDCLREHYPEYSGG